LSINDDVLAEAVDISRSGISCKCLASVDILLTKIQKIELLNCELGTSVKGLHGRLVRSNNRPISLASPSTVIMNFSFEFQNLTPIQRKQLFQFIKDGEWSGIEHKKLTQDTRWKEETDGAYFSRNEDRFWVNE
jgi:hypothetical protein